MVFFGKKRFPYWNCLSYYCLWNFLAATRESFHTLTRNHSTDGVADRLVIIPLAKPWIQTICCVHYMALEPKYLPLQSGIYSLEVSHLSYNVFYTKYHDNHWGFFHVLLIDYIKKWLTAINESLTLPLNELWRFKVFSLLLSFIIYCDPNLVLTYSSKWNRTSQIWSMI